MHPSDPARRYRADIDGLRALAILPVVLFHLGVPGFGGGFVGVDVFFVISGYLITSILLREIAAGEFSLPRFYERRIRRLLPALATMLALVFCVAWFVLLPGDFASFSRALLAAAAFVANMHFWSAVDYFSAPVESHPLLHTWSLAVEEQFYIFFPLILVAVFAKARRHVAPILAGLFLLSLLAAVLTVRTSPGAAFYLFHLRAWELLAGALLATGSIPAITRRPVRELAAGSGLVLIAASVFLLGKESVFPGQGAVPAVFGAALLIHAGGSGPSFVSRVLSVRALVGIGLISYSLYLWHWPAFTLFRYYLVTPPSAALQVLMLGVAMLAGWLSWRFVEQPFRRVSFPGARKVLQAGAACVVLLSLLALPGIIGSGVPSRMPEAVVKIAEVGRERIPFRQDCFGLPPEAIRRGEACRLGAAGMQPRFVLWGDSHALALALAVDQAAGELGLAGVFIGESACPPLADVSLPGFRSGCRSFNDAAMEFIGSQKGVGLVILAGRWSRHFMSDVTRHQALTGIENTLQFFVAREMQVLLVEQVPEVGWDVPSTLARARLFDRPQPRVPGAEDNGVMSALLRDAVRQAAPGTVNLVRVRDAFCDAAGCSAERNGVPLYRDAHHLSTQGSELLQPVLLSELALWLAGREVPSAGGGRVDSATPDGVPLELLERGR